MNLLLLLLQSQPDVEALMACVPRIKGQFDGLWAVYSPAVLISEKEAGVEFDTQIAAYQTQMRACFDREDGQGGHEYKVKRDNAILEKAAKVKEAWRTLPPEKQAGAEDAIFKPFMDAQPAPNMKITRLPDHYEPKDWIAMLNSIKGGWFEPFVAGAFQMNWPTSLLGQGVGVATVAAPVAQAAPTPAPTPVPVAEAPTKVPVSAKTGGYMNSPRYKALLKMEPDQLYEEATKAGIKNPSGHKLKIVHAIMRQYSVIPAAA